MRWRRLVVVAAALGALGAGLLLAFPTKEGCRASGRVVDPTGRHCVAPDGYVQLREHVLFHTVDAAIMVAAAAALWAAGAWLVRRAGDRAAESRRR